MKNHKKKHKPNRANSKGKAKVQDSIVSKDKEVEVPIIADAGLSMLPPINWRKWAIMLGNSYLKLSPLLLTTMIKPAAGDVQCQQSHTEDGDVTAAYIFYSIICQVALVGGYVLKPTLLERTACDTTSTIDNPDGCRCDLPNNSPRLVTEESMAAIQSRLSQVYNQNVMCNFTSAAAVPPDLSKEQVVCGGSATFRNCFTNGFFFGLFHEDRTLVQGGFNNEKVPPNSSLVLNTMTSVFDTTCTQLEEHARTCKSVGNWIFGTVSGAVVFVVVVLLAVCLTSSCSMFFGVLAKFLAEGCRGRSRSPAQGDDVVENDEGSTEPLLSGQSKNKGPEARVISYELPDDFEEMMTIGTGLEINPDLFP